MALPTVSNTTRPRSWGYHARINDLFVRLVPSVVEALVETADQPQRIDTAENPEDISSDVGAGFSRSDFSGGEGLDFAHRPDADPSRFWDSDGIEVVTGKGRAQYLRLANAFDELVAASDATALNRQANQLAYAGGDLFVIDNTTQRVKRIDTPTATASTADENPHAGEGDQNVLALAALDSEVYAAIATNGIHKRTSAGSWSSWSDTTPERIWSLKGRIVSESGGVLAEHSSAGVATTINTIGSDEAHLCAVEAGTDILVGATNGHLYFFYSESGELTLSGQVDFPGEEVTGVAARGGVVLVATRQVGPDGDLGRLYRADLTAQSSLSNMQTMREWDITGSAAAAPGHLTVTRDECWFGFTNADGDEEVWKYAFESGGLFRVATVSTGANGLTGSVVVDERLFFTTGDRAAFRQESTYQSSGYLITPLADHFSADLKAWAALRLDMDDISSDEKVELYYSTDTSAILDPDHPSWVLTKKVTFGNDRNETHLAGVQSRYLSMMVKLYGDTGADVSPVVRAISSRSYPGPSDVVLRLPVNVSDYIERPGRRGYTVPGIGALLYDELKSLEGSSAFVRLFRPSEQVRGTVMKVQTPITAHARRGAPVVVSVVTVRGRRFPETVAASGGSFASYHLFATEPEFAEVS